MKNISIISVPLNNKIMFKRITYIIVAINVLIFLLQISYPSINDNFALQPKGSENYNFIQYLTGCFLHGSWFHLFINMVVLLSFGTYMEEKFGKKLFLILYLFSGIFAGIAWHIFYSPEIAAVGASGALFGVMGAVALFSPNLKILLFFIIPLRIKYAMIVAFLYESYFILFPREGDMVGHFVHVSGLILGCLFYILLMRKHR